MPLTYFEFTALAILWAFKRLKPDVVILEIGLGGRLDAINALDPEASIVTTVDVEHETFLGTTREAVGWEKAHIYRKGKCAVCADDHPPEKLIAVAFDMGADLLLKGRDFYAEKVAHGMRFTYRGYTVDLPEPAMFGVNQIDNAAGTLAVVYSLLKRLPVTVDDIAQGLRTAKLPGRFEKIADSPLVIVDVGHNPHAARVLVKNLEASRVPGKTYAVFGMLKDKDMSKVVELVAPEIDAWFVSGLPGVRGASEDELVRAMLQAGVTQDAITREADIPRAFEKAKEAARPEDRILVFGSFVTVTAFLEKGLA